MNYCLYHKNCMDGLFAAYAIYHRHGYMFNYIAVQYNKQIPQEILDDPFVGDIVIVDYSYPRETLETIRGFAKRLYVLDHHATAENELKGLDYCKFENNKSGAVMAYEWVYPGLPVPPLFEYVQDRDLWRWLLPDSKAINEGLRNELDFKDDVINNFHKISDILCREFGFLKSNGETIIKYRNSLIDELVGHLFIKIAKIGGFEYNFGMINGGLHSLNSDVGNTALLKDQSLDFVMIYSINELVYVSLRGLDRVTKKEAKIVDCGELAKLKGGGGHKNAAGFKIKSINNLIPWV